MRHVAITVEQGHIMLSGLSNDDMMIYDFETTLCNLCALSVAYLTKTQLLQQDHKQVGAGT